LTTTCQLQMQDLTAHRQDYEERGAVALGMEDGLLLADFWPHGEVAKKYGIFDGKSGASKRAVFIVDEAGVVRWKKV
jgi:peroxiredoxin